MTDALLKIITQLFAVFASLAKDQEGGAYQQALRNYLNAYTTGELRQQLEGMFAFYLQRYNQVIARTPEKRISIKAVKMLRLLEPINAGCSKTEKVDLVFRLMDAIDTQPLSSEDEEDFLTTLFLSFSFDEQLMKRMRAFLRGDVQSFANQKQLMIVSSDESVGSANLLHLQREGLKGQIFIIYVEALYKFYFRYVGEDRLFLNGETIESGAYYEFKKGQSITSYKIGFYNVKLKPIYFTEVVLQFVGSWSTNRVRIQAIDAAYNFPDGQTGIHPFNFQTESFLLVGIMGGSGAGKSTFMNLLNGNHKPSQGKILLNGYDVYAESHKVRGLIGYVPQEDLLIEELTVWDNLYINAQLCFAHCSREELTQKVERLLREMALFDVRNLHVGTALDKTISGGQRKRLNLALEILREPALLFVDEPTSGLSSSDSRKVMNILREVTLQGKLVVVNIHQPSSEIYRQLDQLVVLDEGGYVVYNGDALEAIVYFKTLSNQANVSQKECPACGNINPDQLLEIIQEPQQPDHSSGEAPRLVPPEKWAQWYKETLEEPLHMDDPQGLPPSGLHIPKKGRQLRIFLKRTIKTKLPNTSYWLISLLEAPLLALILGYFSKYNAGTVLNTKAYVFSENVNVPAYLLMTVIVALFLGMLISAEEIIKDAKIRQRESFLQLSWTAYLNAKLLFLFLLIAYQSMAFVWVGNTLLEIHGMFGYYSLIVFSIGIFAVLLGLLLSTYMKSVVTIYIVIPFLIIPQILLSGVLVKFDKLHSSLSNKIEPPFVANLMASRWGFEALAVVQFTRNEYQAYFYEIEKQESMAFYFANYYIPALEKELDQFIHLQQNNELSSASFSILRNRLMQIPASPSKKAVLESLFANKATPLDLFAIRTWLNERKVSFFTILDQIFARKDKQVDSLRRLNISVTRLKRENHNQALSDLVKDMDDTRKWVEHKGNWIRTMEPVFLYANDQYSPYYSPRKFLMGYELPTWVYNVIQLWLLNLFLYLFLRWPGSHLPFTKQHGLNYLYQKLHLIKGRKEQRQ